MLITVSNRSGSYALPFQPGQTLLDALRQAGLPVSAPCGGRGTCGKCTVYLSTPDGERAVLACRRRRRTGWLCACWRKAPWPWSWKGSSILCPAPPDPEAAGWGLACDIGHHHRGVPSGGAVHRPRRRHLGGGQRPAALRRRCDRPHQGIYGRAAPSPHRRHPGSTIPDGRALCQKAGVPLAEVHTMRWPPTPPCATCWPAWPRTAWAAPPSSLCPGLGSGTAPGSWSCPLTGRCTSPRRCPAMWGRYHR